MYLSLLKCRSTALILKHSIHLVFYVPYNFINKTGLNLCFIILNIGYISLRDYYYDRQPFCNSLTLSRTVQSSNNIKLTYKGLFENGLRGRDNICSK